MEKFKMFAAHHTLLALLLTGVAVPAALVVCVSIFTVLTAYPVALFMGWI